MQARDLSARLTDWMRNPERDKNYEYRDYVGMSAIGGCPRQSYFRFMDPEPPDDRMNWYAWVGYTFEYAIVDLLKGAGFKFHPDVEQHDLVANFDPRYRGHIDHLLADKTLIEIKSVYWDKYLRLREQGRPEALHYDQCQAYMRHGKFPRAIIIYTPRDIPHREWDDSHRGNFLSFWTYDIFRNERRMDELDQKAKAILAAIDCREPPECTCRYCRR